MAARSSAWSASRCDDSPGRHDHHLRPGAAQPPRRPGSDLAWRGRHHRRGVAQPERSARGYGGRSDVRERPPGGPRQPGKLLPNSRILSSTAEAAPYFAAEALDVATEPARHVWGRHLILDSATHGDGLVNPPSQLRTGRRPRSSTDRALPLGPPPATPASDQLPARYFTVTTASTTGYGDINLLYSPWWVRL